MNKEVRSKLIELARKKRTITYQYLSDTCKLGLILRESDYAKKKMERILDEITVYEYSNERPLISSIVVTNEADNVPGPDFYIVCEKLGFGNQTKIKEEIDFENNQVNACFDFWSDDKNYAAHKEAIV